MKGADRLGVRWTIGDVSERGFEALRLSAWGAWRVFGPEAAYAVCVNSLPLERARELAGELPPGVVWHEATAQVPEFLKAHCDEAMAEGVAWKFAPLRFFPDRFELSLDNDCIFWEAPPAIRRWLEEGDPVRCVAAEDVLACFGQFAELCGPEPRNAGIRGLPPGFDFEATLRTILQRHPVVLSSELDEQGLQTAALRWHAEPRIVTVEEVSICSPFPPHLPHLGRCGAHFVGLNARQLPWSLEGRPASDYIREHWDRHRESLYERVRPGERARTAAAA
ncbi:MAG TPA: hypothetical protein VFU47_13390 [Armatimonadota bacterium]|nr:hypothetical protein [Armatimonadota bacterium]